ncbi:MAG: OmpH family outer membrane protein [Verrucomicrobia bacterium]|jgi:Skp family chaperone for outer membrane proteins|nr:OmpH family outer membrane protein [Verrucomicrobiota bacterium]NCC60666.1 OmpH family outer membrane protein [Verrucomicrobiae bacterium]
MKKLILTSLACLIFAFSTQAQSQKIATIDVRKVLENYYLTWQEDAAYQQENQRLVQEAAEAHKLYEAADKKFTEILNSTKAKDLPPEVLSKNEQEAAKAFEERKKLESALASFRENAIKNLAARKKRTQQDILKKVNETIAKQAQKEGYTLVLNTSIDASNPYRAVIFDSGKHDISDEILLQLNATKPEKLAKPESLLLFN